MDFKEKETLSKMAALARFTRHLNDLKPVQKTKKKNKKKFGITFDSHKRAAGSTCWLDRVTYGLCFQVPDLFIFIPTIRSSFCADVLPLRIQLTFYFFPP